VAERSRQLTPEQSIYEACMLRYRVACPWRSEQAQDRSCAGRLASRSLAACYFSQFLTLFTTPVIYIYPSKLGRLVRRRRGSPENVLPPLSKDHDPERLRAAE